MKITLDDIRRQGFAKTTLLASGWNAESIRTPDLLNALSEVVRQVSDEIGTSCPDITPGGPGWNEIQRARDQLKVTAVLLRDTALMRT